MGGTKTTNDEIRVKSGRKQEKKKEKEREGEQEGDWMDDEYLFLLHNYCKLTPQIVNCHPLIAFIKYFLNVIKLPFKVKYFTPKHYSQPASLTT